MFSVTETRTFFLEFISDSFGCSLFGRCRPAAVVGRQVKGCPTLEAVDSEKRRKDKET